MVKVTSFGNGNYYPPNFSGLEEIVLYPGGELRNGSIPNHSVWVFNGNSHKFKPEIFGSDIGCGMVAHYINEVDPEEAAEKLGNILKGKKILGGGNHFVDICSPIDTISDTEFPPHMLLILHTDMKLGDTSKPKSLLDAMQIQIDRAKLREELAMELGQKLNGYIKPLGNWTHNSVEIEYGNIIYRKGSVKVEPGKPYILPAHLGAYIEIYTINPNNLPPYHSMPHATGRSVPRAESKEMFTAEEVGEWRKNCNVHIPNYISNLSLRSEIPLAYNDFEEISKQLGQGKVIVPIGKTKILSYIGKV